MKINIKDYLEYFSKKVEVFGKYHTEKVMLLNPEMKDILSKENIDILLNSIKELQETGKIEEAEKLQQEHILKLSTINTEVDYDNLEFLIQNLTISTVEFNQFIYE